MTFHFVTDGIASALERARAAARGKDVRISGGADTIRQYRAAGLVDELTLHIAPTSIGNGLRLLDPLRPATLKLEQVSATASPHVMHVTYRIVR